MFMGRKGTRILLSSLDSFQRPRSSQEPKVTEELLGKLVLKKLKEFGWNVNLYVGIGTDNVRKSRGPKSNSKGSIERFSLSNAYFNHALNLTISVSSSVVSIRNSIGVIKETIAFLTSSAKRRVVVDSI
jgi:KaiC/GvpD/RAD55 family RecA-like ATPase